MAYLKNTVSVISLNITKFPNIILDKMFLKFCSKAYRNIRFMATYSTNSFELLVSLIFSK